MRLTFLCLLCVALQGAGVHAQVRLTVVPAGAEDRRTLDALAGDLKLPASVKDSLAARAALRRFLDDLHANGYLGASVDSLATGDTAVQAFVTTGTLYRWVRLSPGNVDEGILSEAGFRERVYRNKPLSLAALGKVQDRLLDWCDRNGYPFAEVRYDSLRFDGGRVSAALHLERHRQIHVDSILVRGSSRLSPVYLYHYLAVKPGRPYNEAVIRKIPNRIKELPMVTEARPLGVSFHQDAATLYLYLEHRKASQLDGVVGVLPDNSGNGKVTVTGDVHMKLFSAFGHGELFDLNWKQPLPKTQDLRTRFNYPFLFATPFGIDLGLAIYKKDTTYLELNRTVGIQYLLTGGNFIKAFYNNKKSSLIDASQFENATTLPSFADIRVNSYGLGVQSEKVDYRYNPRRGYAAALEGSVGRKRIEPNARLKQVDYDSLKLNSTQYNLAGSGDWYLPLFSRNVVDIGFQGGLLHGDETFQNELFRIGGLRTLRGFDEESILASAYVIWKAEFRYVLEQNSYLFLFVNGAWYERRQRDYFVTDTPLGFGAGITFETGLGIFSLNYALGREFDNPVLIRAGKVHFGLVNYF